MNDSSSNCLIRINYTALACVIGFVTQFSYALEPRQILEQDARNRQRQQEQEQSLRSAMEDLQPEVRLDRPASSSDKRLPAQETPCFPIERITLIGDQSAQFEWALAAANAPDMALGRCLGSEGINLVMGRIQDAIVQRGFVTTRLFAGEQSLTTGTLVLTVVPGRIRAIRPADGVDSRVTLWNALPMKTGDLLNLRDIEQGLENLKRVPTAEADIEIVPASGEGAQPGESDLVVKWQQALPVRISLSIDDSGSESTGKLQGSATVSLDHILTLNDLFYASFNHDLSKHDDQYGTDGYAVHYSIPLGYWSFAWNHSASSYYQNVAGAYQDYQYSGNSKNSDITVSHLFWRDASSKSTWRLKGWTRMGKNYIEDVEVEVQRRRTSGWEAGLSHRQHFGESTLDLDVAYRRGTGANDALRAPEEAFGEGTSRMALWTASAQWGMPFKLAGVGLRYSANWRAQLDRTPLVAQDRFSIGNRYTVRGFDGESTLMAERGWVLRNDLGWAIPELGSELYLGLDYGQVAGRTAQYLLGRELAGYVLGLRGQIKSLGYEAFAGQPLIKPDGFKTAPVAVGFNVNLSF
ncbi:ShlB/FhaC/HecB family hemolysin secretion/activation protein [Chitinibacter sp. S2-10]|uniref:ShlB/FhaC/HecB family hemolysin secretion/activation protein n=1 Tax=Chitinibacter sp. S2-10 TaxID=3373597 RepID=UPI0039773E45